MRLLIIILFLALIEMFNVGFSVEGYIFKTESHLSIFAENFGTIKPGEKVSSDITISYKYGKFARPEGFLFKREPTTITLSVKAPEWCSFELNKGYFEVEIVTSFVPRTVNLSARISIRVDTNAPGFEEGKIILEARAEENGNIESSSANCELSVKVGFVPGIEVRLSNSSLNLKVGERKNLSLYVRNKSNSKIVANISLLNESNLEIYLPKEKSIDPDEEVPFLINLRARETNRGENLTFITSFYAYNHPEFKGTPALSTLEVSVKGKEEEPGFPLPLLIIAILAVILPLVYFYLNK
jgi:hypothetical protein